MTTISMPVPGKISLNIDMELTFKEVTANFGDSQQQVSPLGIHPMVELWQITWAPLTQSEYQTILAAVRSVGTWGKILWTPEDETVERTFKIKSGTSFRRTRIARRQYQATLTLEENFSVG
jgi:phage-related protein